MLAPQALVSKEETLQYGVEEALKKSVWLGLGAIVAMNVHIHGRRSKKEKNSTTIASNVSSVAHTYFDTVLLPCIHVPKATPFVL